jgi:hypothetical protein
MISGGVYMQACDSLKLECYSWLPFPGGAAPNVVAEAEYHIGIEADPPRDRLNRTHAFVVEVIHRTGELPIVKFEADWPADLELTWKSEIVANAIAHYISDPGSDAFQELQSLFKDLTVVRKPA